MRRLKRSGGSGRGLHHMRAKRDSASNGTTAVVWDMQNFTTTTPTTSAVAALSTLKPDDLQQLAEQLREAWSVAEGLRSQYAALIQLFLKAETKSAQLVLYLRYSTYNMELLYVVVDRNEPQHCI